MSKKKPAKKTAKAVVRKAAVRAVAGTPVMVVHKSIDQKEAEFIERKKKLGKLQDDNQKLFTKLRDAKVNIKVYRYAPITRLNKLTNSVWRVVLTPTDKAILQLAGSRCDIQKYFFDLPAMVQNMMAKASKPVYAVQVYALKGGTPIAQGTSVCVAEDAKNKIRGEIKTIGLNIALHRLANEVSTEKAS